jgi:hypothetical protein
MKWTKKSPKETGWYWFQSPAMDNPRIYQVYESEGELRVPNIFNEKGYLKANQVLGLWWPERIPEPEQ